VTVAPDPDDVPLTSGDRVVFPADKITKGDVVAYYRDVAARMLPHLEGRPLVLERHRKDIAAGGFYQQGRPDHFPDYVPRIDVVRADGEVGHHTGCDSAAALVYLANQGTLTFHAWSSRLPDLERPDRLVLDLDPPGEDFEPVREAALMLREVLTEAGFVGLPMTTGSRGLHIIVPLDGSRTWEEVWPLAKELGAALVKRDPTTLTRAFYKSQRRGRLYVDTGRARRGHLAIVPWTVRARPGAPVATPITWQEVADAAIHAQYWTLKTALARPEDPWAALLAS
jgi:bifunctional non-homologous end joining protein LigD